MSSQKTEYYELNQWLATDQVLRTDFNADNAKIDAALAALNSGKADGAAFATLSATVAGHAAILGQLGNCRIEHFSYTGNGVDGQQSSRTISFPEAPLCFLIIGHNAIGVGARSNNYVFVSYSLSNVTIAVTWTGDQFTLTSGRVDSGLNVSGFTYHVIAFYSRTA